MSFNFNPTPFPLEDDFFAIILDNNAYDLIGIVAVKDDVNDVVLDFLIWPRLLLQPLIAVADIPRIVPVWNSFSFWKQAPMWCARAAGIVAGLKRVDAHFGKALDAVPLCY